MAEFAKLRPAGITQRDGWSQLSWELKWRGSESFLLNHAVREENAYLLAEPERGDHAIVAVLLWTMGKGYDLDVEGKVSPKLLDGLEKLQEIWHRWRPERYRKITINVEEEREPEVVSADRPAVFAFSGGVDASFTLFRHLQQEGGRNNKKPGAALIVQGMDIPIDRDDFYLSATERAQQILSETTVPLIGLKANPKGLGQDWVDSFGLQLAACFLVLQRHYAAALHGSGEPYNTLLMPWGSTPLTDPLTSTEAIKVNIYGCDYDRTEKVEWLSKNTSICDFLRVCWAGPKLGENCGECEKCIRTMLNFWAAGQVVPNAFPTKLAPELIKKLKPKNEIQLREIQSLYRHACQHYPESDEKMKAVRFVMKRYRLKNRIEPYVRHLHWRLQKHIQKFL